MIMIPGAIQEVVPTIFASSESSLKSVLRIEKPKSASLGTSCESIKTFLDLMSL